MKKLIVILLLFIFLTGCDNSVKQAKARSQRAATDRANDRHNLAMADSRTLAPVRLVVKEVLLWTLMASGAIVILGTGLSFTYFVAGASLHTIRNMRIQQVQLDVATRQYPLLIYANGRRSFNPNNGERLRLSDGSAADPRRIEASEQVQLAGLITDNNKIINGESNR